MRASQVPRRNDLWSTASLLNKHFHFETHLKQIYSSILKSKVDFWSNWWSIEFWMLHRMLGNPLNFNLNPHWCSQWEEASTGSLLSGQSHRHVMERSRPIRSEGNSPSRFAHRVDLARQGSCDYWLQCMEEFIPNKTCFCLLRVFRLYLSRRSENTLSNATIPVQTFSFHHFRLGTGLYEVITEIYHLLRFD